MRCARLATTSIVVALITLAGHAVVAEPEHDFTTVFGIKLGEPLTIPMCTEDDAARPGAFDKNSKGDVAHAEVKRTCATNRFFRYEFATAVDIWFATPPLEVRRLSLVLIDGRIAGAFIDEDPDVSARLEQELEEKYGTPEERYEKVWFWNSGGVGVAYDVKGHLVIIITDALKKALGEWARTHSGPWSPRTRSTSPSVRTPPH